MKKKLEDGGRTMEKEKEEMGDYFTFACCLS